MYGYVTADIQKLSKSERREYKAYYCGLCRTLAARYGIKGTALLSFDTVFLFTVLAAMQREIGDCVSLRCPYRFNGKCSCHVGKEADYAADITVLLAYLKLEDDIADNKSVKARLLRKIYSKTYEKALSRRPEQGKALKRILGELYAAESRGEINPDIPANIFGELLGYVFSYNKAAEKFGHRLGRLIYLSDAACDFKSDLKHGRYNPLVCCRMSDFDGILAQAAAECSEEYEKLLLYRAKAVTDNVIYCGIHMKYDLVKKLRGKKQ